MAEAGVIEGQAADALHAVRGFLARRAAVVSGALVGVALAMPSLGAGLCADDWMQLLIARGLRPFAGLPASRFDLFSFAGRDPGSTRALIDAGVFPWWADPSMKLAFFRPLSVLTHLADQALWPDTPALMHAQSLFWFALALLAVGAFYRRVLPGWAAGAAALLYAADDAHALAVGWIANRNAMIAVACGVPALIAHDRWRRDGSRAGAVAGPLLFAVALCAGESAIAVFGYLLAYATCLDRGSLCRRAASLAPHAAVVAAWRLCYGALGYGTVASGVYFDPASEPLAWLRAAPARAAHLLAGQFALPWSDFAPVWPLVSARAAAIALAVAASSVVLLAITFAPLCARDRTARFFALGTLFSVVPVASTFPADRLLFFTGIGAMGLIATFLERAPRRAWFAPAAAALLVLHGALSPAMLAFRSAHAMTAVERPLLEADRSLPSTLALAGRTLVLVDAPADFIPSYLWLMRGTAGQRLPALRWLSSGTGAVRLWREDARTLRVRPADGFLGHEPDRMLRDPFRHPFARGQSIELTGLRIEVTDLL
ncbi:MAG TPA: hypothetical protein VLW85_13225, partial [Myxococcales bacterium]|nr:hypothetical protein [Myxococcales bacterium]